MSVVAVADANEAKQIHLAIPREIALRVCGKEPGGVGRPRPTYMSKGCGNPERSAVECLMRPFLKEEQRPGSSNQRRPRIYRCTATRDQALALRKQLLWYVERLSRVLQKKDFESRSERTRQRKHQAADIVHQIEQALDLSGEVRTLADWSTELFSQVAALRDILQGYSQYCLDVAELGRQPIEIDLLLDLTEYLNRHKAFSKLEVLT